MGGRKPTSAGWGSSTPGTSNGSFPSRRRHQPCHRRLPDRRPGSRLPSHPSTHRGPSGTKRRTCTASVHPELRFRYLRELRWAPSRTGGYRDLLPAQAMPLRQPQGQRHPQAPTNAQYPSGGWKKTLTPRRRNVYFGCTPTLGILDHTKTQTRIQIQRRDP